MFETWNSPPEESQDLGRATPERSRRADIETADSVIGETAGHLNAAHARLLEELETIDTLDGWSDQGAKSCEEWLAWRCGLPLGEARHHVRVARRLKGLPKIKAAFGRGELSYWQVRAMAPIATPEIEQSLLDIARHSTATQLTRIARAYKGCLDRVELERSNERHASRGLHHFYDDDGFLVIRGRLTPEDGALLLAALDAAEKAMHEETTDEAAAEPVPAEARRADALVDVARRSQVAPENGKEPRPEVLVHVDVPSLVDGSGGRCEIEDGSVLASETARRLCCDATIQAVYERDGEVLDFGRRRRVIPPRLRRALEQRDETCRFPGCGRKRFRQGHHIVFWGHGQKGKTNKANCVLLCPFHHHLVHEGGFRIEGDANGELTFIRPDGRVVPDENGLGEGDVELLKRKHEEAQLAIDDRTCTTLWDGDPPDFDTCVRALLSEGG
ncbi:MAG: HNH endonuclease, partial [Actinomycetota bacterium]|nr:HNH endonuclease [Actinomycetota bacterium]